MADGRADRNIDKTENLLDYNEDMPPVETSRSTISTQRPWTYEYLSIDMTIDKLCWTGRQIWNNWLN